MTNYEFIKNEIVPNKKKLALFLASLDDINDWVWTAKTMFLPWLDKECELNYDDYGKYFIDYEKYFIERVENDD